MHECTFQYRMLFSVKMPLKRKLRFSRLTPFFISPVAIYIYIYNVLSELKILNYFDSNFRVTVYRDQTTTSSTRGKIIPYNIKSVRCPNSTMKLWFTIHMHTQGLRKTERNNFFFYIPV